MARGRNDITARIRALYNELPPQVTLVAVSKTRSDEEIREAYDAGQRVFGENKVQELVSKASRLPTDIEWHLIGHLQSNKVKFIAPFVSMIHSVDSLRLLSEINKEAGKCGRIIPCLLQFHIAREESKFGLDLEEAVVLLESEQYRSMRHIFIAGVMGMATFSTDVALVRKEFSNLREIFNTIRNQFFASSARFTYLSMGMSGDYPLAIEEGSNMVRIGSNIFGER